MIMKLFKFVLFVGILSFSCKVDMKKKDLKYYTDFDVKTLTPLGEETDQPTSYPFIKDYRDTVDERSFKIVMNKEAETSFSFSKEENWTHEEDTSVADLALTRYFIKNDQKLYVIAIDKESQMLIYVNVESNDMVYQYNFKNPYYYKSLEDLKKFLSTISNYRILKIERKIDKIVYTEIEKFASKNDSILTKACYPRRTYTSIFMFQYDLINIYDDEVACK